MSLSSPSSIPIKNLSSGKKSLVLAGMFAVILVIGMADYLTGYELAFSIFYLFPVAIVTWYVGWEAGATFSVFSGLVWYTADALSRTEPYSSMFVPAWNTGVRVMTFLIVTFLLTILRETLERESTYARVDPLTEAANSRAFYEATEIQISLLRRHQQPFSIVYLDIDNFKALNDAQGHSAGDRALQNMVAIMKRNLRPVDVITRLGGDEFAVLLADADAGAAEAVSSRIQAAIHHNLPFTCSIGVLTCTTVPESVDALVEQVDNLMYEAKHGGKDTRMSSTLSGKS